MEVSELFKPMIESLQRLLDITEVNYNIKKLEADLEYHQERARLFGQALKEQQDILWELQDLHKSKKFEAPSNE